MEEEKENIQLRFQGLLERTVELMEEVLADEIRDYRSPGAEEPEDSRSKEERVFRKVDTKALKEFLAALGELKELLGEKESTDTALRVVFEAGEEAFNE